MSGTPDKNVAGEELVKQNLISREDLEKAQEQEQASGTPWYKQLLQRNLISFGAVEDVLRYEIHPADLLSSTSRTEQKSLGDQLVQQGDLTGAQLKEALSIQKRTGRRLGQILVDQGFTSRTTLQRTLAKQNGIEFALLEKCPSSRDALETVPEGMARKNKMLPVSIEGDRLTVLIDDPQTSTKLQSTGVLLGRRIHPILTAVDDLMEEIGRRYAGLNLDFGGDGQASGRHSSRKFHLDEAVVHTINHSTETLEGKSSMSEHGVQQERAEEGSRFEQIARDASGSSVIKMVQTIIEGAVNSGATDIHLDPQEPEMRVRYRIDGILHDILSIPPGLETAVVSRIKIMADLDITETRRPQDGHISTEIGNRDLDVRVATLPTFLGERVVCRLLDQSSILSGIRDLGLEADDEERLGRIIDQPYGMILVTGPTGSGKTTTLYAALNQKNVMTDSIVTLEDPVEYQLSGINQVQIDNDIGVTFANTLRAALRQDIDVLLVGEIRDAETAKIAVRAAMTGHLVFSTLHTNDAPEAISTLRNMGVPSFLIASALTAVIGQRLVRTICTGCKTEFKPNSSLLKSLQLPPTTKKLYRGAGCESCFNTGNRGRTGIFEVLEINAALRNLIGEDASVEQLCKSAKLKTMATRCRQKVKDGVVNPEEFLRVIRT